MRKLANAAKTRIIPILRELADRSVTLFILTNRSDKAAETPLVANLVETLDDQTKSSKKTAIQEIQKSCEPRSKATPIEYGGIGRAPIARGADGFAHFPRSGNHRVHDQ